MKVFKRNPRDFYYIAHTNLKIFIKEEKKEGLSDFF